MSGRLTSANVFSAAKSDEARLLLGPADASPSLTQDTYADVSQVQELDLRRTL